MKNKLELTKKQFLKMWEGTCSYRNHDYEDFESNHETHSILFIKSDELNVQTMFGNKINLEIERISEKQKDNKIKCVGRIMFNNYIEYYQTELTNSEYELLILDFNYAQEKFLKEKNKRVIDICEKELKKALDLIEKEK